MSFSFKKYHEKVISLFTQSEDLLQELDAAKEDGAVMNGLRSIRNMLSGLEDAFQKEKLEDATGKMVGLVKTSGQLMGQINSKKLDMDDAAGLLEDILRIVSPMLKEANKK